MTIKGELEFDQEGNIKLPGKAGEYAANRRRTLKLLQEMKKKLEIEFIKCVPKADGAKACTLKIAAPLEMIREAQEKAQSNVPTENPSACLTYPTSEGAKLWVVGRGDDRCGLCRYTRRTLATSAYRAGFSTKQAVACDFDNDGFICGGFIHPAFFPSSKKNSESDK